MLLGHEMDLLLLYGRWEGLVIAMIKGKDDGIGRMGTVFGGVRRGVWKSMTWKCVDADYNNPALCIL